MSDWEHNGATVVDEHGAHDETSDIGTHDATPPAEPDRDATRDTRNARTPRTRRRNNGHVPGDLATVLHRHLAKMGPSEAAHALDTLERLTTRPSAEGPRVHPAWLAQLAVDLGEHRTGPAISRLVYAVVELVPIIHAADNDAAVAAVIGFARAQTTAAQEAAAARQSRRR